MLPTQFSILPCLSGTLNSFMHAPYRFHTLPVIWTASNRLFFDLASPSLRPDSSYRSPPFSSLAVLANYTLLTDRIFYHMSRYVRRDIRTPRKAPSRAKQLSGSSLFFHFAVRFLLSFHTLSRLSPQGPSSLNRATAPSRVPGPPRWSTRFVLFCQPPPLLPVYTSRLLQLGGRFLDPFSIDFSPVLIFRTHERAVLACYNVYAANQR